MELFVFLKGRQTMMHQQRITPEWFKTRKSKNFKKTLLSKGNIFNIFRRKYVRNQYFKIKFVFLDIEILPPPQTSGT